MFAPRCRQNKVIQLLNIPDANFDESLIVQREHDKKRHHSNDGLFFPFFLHVKYKEVKIYLQNNIRLRSQNLTSVVRD